MYPTSSNSNIGTLLRLIQEDQNKSLPALNPASDPNSPIRGVVQGPLLSPEDPGSSRQVSIRPEGVTQSGSQGSVVAPVNPVGQSVAAPRGVVAPVAPVARPSAVSVPSASQAAPQRSASPSVSTTASKPASINAATPTIGTKITSAPKSVLGASTSLPKTTISAPQRATIGTKIASTPSYQGFIPGKSVLDNLINSLLNKTGASKSVQKLAPKLFA